jgi:glycosyltransferase involved in cell wall biosynthesis
VTGSKAGVGQQGILFVSHEASRTGAPTNLLHFLRWFRRYSDRPFSVLLGQGGELVPEFEKLGSTWSILQSRWIPGGLRASLLSNAGLGARARRAETADAQRFAARCSPALVYANSIASARAIEVLDPRIPLLTHVHELETRFQMLASPALTNLLTKTTKFIACSKAVQSNLVKNHGIDAAAIETVCESIPVDEIRATRTRKQVLGELRIPNEALVVVGSGTADWCKGPDLFVQLAREVCRQRHGAYFVWVGGGPNLRLAEFEHDIRLTGLTEKIRRTGAVKNPAEYLAASDVFALTSREDSFPLVCLEAAALGKPIVCFASAGGMPEFVEENCGFVTPYIDIIAMAERIVHLLDSSDLRKTMGECARRKAAERHDVKNAARTIVEIIEKTIPELLGQ